MSDAAGWDSVPRSSIPLPKPVYQPGTMIDPRVVREYESPLVKQFNLKDNLAALLDIQRDTKNILTQMTLSVVGSTPVQEKPCVGPADSPTHESLIRQLADTVHDVRQLVMNLQERIG